MKKYYLIATIGLGLFAAGCSTTINTPQGKIVSITERGIGFEVTATDETTQSPKVKFGFFSSAIVIEPTSTNTPTYSPNFANTFDFSQAGALSLGIGENIASGNYQTLQPVIPK
jgi:hypothetical protein